MNKFATLLAMVFVLVVCASSAFAQATGTTPPAAGSMIDFSPYFGIGLVVIGAGMGIGKLAAAALESMARQPEVAGSVQTAMIIAAALIEGFTFYALYLCTP